MPDNHVANSTVRENQLLLLDADTVAEMRGRATDTIDLAREKAFEGRDNLAATLRRGLANRPVRAAVMAVSVDQARERLDKLVAVLRDDTTTIDVGNGVFAGRAGGDPHIGYVFPGQGSYIDIGGDVFARRFAAARDFYDTVTLPTEGDPTSLGASQPRIVASSVAAVRVLSGLGIEATVALGHSLGEVTALHWAGVMSESQLLDLASAHGQILGNICTGNGAMGIVAADPEGTERLLHGEPVFVAGYNNPGQTVIAGPAEAVARVRMAARSAGLGSAILPVSDAFHTPAMAPAEGEVRAYLTGARLRPLERRVVSTVTGDALPPDTDVVDLLVRQLCEPVRFSQAVRRMADEVSLILEVGPGRLLSGHVPRICPTVPVVPLATDDESLSGVLAAAAAAHVLGGAVRHDQLPAELA
jgi:acyl transferase domain-containing protein